MTGHAAAAGRRPGTQPVTPAPVTPALALVGYACIHTPGPCPGVDVVEDQVGEDQVHALTGAGCARVFADQPTQDPGRAAGQDADRPQLAACLASLRPGDTLVVSSLDQLAPALPDLVDLVAELRRRGVGFRSLQEGLDPATPGGRLAGDLLLPLAEFLRQLLEEDPPREPVPGGNTGAQPASSGDRVGPHAQAAGRAGSLLPEPLR